MELMAEDPERQRRRQYLQREKEKITKAQEWLATAKKVDDDENTNAMDGFQNALGMRLESPVPKEEFPSSMELV